MKKPYLERLKIKLTKKQLKEIRRVFYNQLWDDWIENKAGYITAEPIMQTGILHVAYLPKERGRKVYEQLHKKDTIEINKKLLKEHL